MNPILHNDEGMWLPGRLPIGQLKKMYGFEPSPEWYEKVQKSCVRINSGGSASFVSSRGLLITNHHVAEGILDDLTTEDRDYVRDGFYAEKLEDEVPAKQLEVNVLWEVQDVTDRIRSVITDSKNPAESSRKKKAEISRIEKESFESTGLRSNVVTLYRGGAYHLYRYKKYTDVRLVFAPEKAIASFGGDIDNYEFPRYCLDIAFLRVYENGKPLKTGHFFSWFGDNSKEGDLLFVAGHPGKTDRLSTLARLRYLRDSGLPFQLNLLRRKEIGLQQFSGRSVTDERKALHYLHGVQNIRKRFLGQLGALQDPAFMFQKEKREKELMTRVRASGEMADLGDAWRMVQDAESKLEVLRDELNLLEGGTAFETRFFNMARTIIRLAEEDQKLDDERLPEYTDSNRDSLLRSLFSPAPIHRDLEQYNLADALAYFIETTGADSELVKMILGSGSPKAVANELMSGTKLDDVNERKRLVEGGKKAVESSDDSFIRLALLVDEKAREVRKDFEENVEEVREQAYAKIAKAMFTAYGEDVYPDATFTLRITFGRVLGYTDDGVKIPYSTSVAGIYDHAEKHNNKGCWEIPDRWLRVQEELKTQEYPPDFNFITTHDIHGGNSGSPMFDSSLKFRGIIFDGNIYGNSNAFLYTDDVARAVSVHAAGITAALHVVYGAERLLNELGIKED